MKKIKIYPLLLTMLVTILFSACQQEVISTADDMETLQTGSVEFVYNKMAYSSAYKVVTNTVVWEQEAVGVLYQKLMELPDLATLVREDGTMELFDTYNDLPMNEAVKESSNTLRATAASYFDQYNLNASNVTLYLYQGFDLTGNVHTWNATRKDGVLTIELPELMPVRPPLAPIPFSDLLSSFRITHTPTRIYDPATNTSTIVPMDCTLGVTLFEDTNYKGHSITFSQVVRTYEMSVMNLTKYTMVSGFLGIGKKNWDNRASSLKYWGFMGR